jgi:4-diphosphocytidyl-2C-methyl-D-erythritol kinase
MSAESLQRKLQDAVDVMLDSIDKEKMRPLQKSTYLKMAACFESKSATAPQIENCIHNSSNKVQISQQIIQQEMNSFQSRLQRCMADCEDVVRDKFPNITSEQQQSQAQGQLLQGMSGCVDKHIALLKSVKYKIESDIDKVK